MFPPISAECSTVMRKTSRERWHFNFIPNLYLLPLDCRIQCLAPDMPQRMAKTNSDGCSYVFQRRTAKQPT